MTTKTNHPKQPGLGDDFAPAEIINALPALYSTEAVAVADKVIVAKWFSPYSNFTWYAVEFEPTTRNIFCYVQSDFSEWGYSNLDEMQAVTVFNGVPGVERDTSWEPITVREAVERRLIEAKANGIIDPEMDR